jgi:hypothetical protein
MTAQLSEALKENSFPNVALDEKDRAIIVTAFKHGHEGVGFNKLVEELKGSVSRSTVSSKASRLSKLGYLERLAAKSRGDLKPVRVSFRCYSILSLIEELAQRTRNENQNQDYEDLRNQWNRYFAMTGSVAMLYGERAAADLFLPLMMENYGMIIERLFSLLEKDPSGIKSFFETHISPSNLEDIRKRIRKQQNKWNS